MLDLNMLVMTQGAERTEEQFRDILREAGFGLLDVIETGAVSSVLMRKGAMNDSFRRILDQSGSAQQTYRLRLTYRSF